MAKKTSTRKSLKNFFSRSELDLKESVEKEDSGNALGKRFKLFKFKLKKNNASVPVQLAEESPVVFSDAGPGAAGEVLLEREAGDWPEPGQSKRKSFFGTMPKSKVKDFSYSEMDLRKPKKFGSFTFNGLSRKKKKKEDVSRSMVLHSPELKGQEGEETMDLSQWDIDQANRRVQCAVSQPELDLETITAPAPPPVVRDQSPSSVRLGSQPESSVRLSDQSQSSVRLSNQPESSVRLSNQPRNRSDPFHIGGPMGRAPIATIPELLLDEPEMPLSAEEEGTHVVPRVTPAQSKHNPSAPTAHVHPTSSAYVERFHPAPSSLPSSPPPHASYAPDSYASGNSDVSEAPLSAEIPSSELEIFISGATHDRVGVVQPASNDPPNREACPLQADVTLTGPVVKMDASGPSADCPVVRDSELCPVSFESPVPAAVSIDPGTVSDDDAEFFSVASDSPPTETVANAVASVAASDDERSPARTAAHGSLYSSLFSEGFASEILSATSNHAPGEELHAKLSSGISTGMDDSPLPDVSDVNDQSGYDITEDISALTDSENADASYGEPSPVGRVPKADLTLTEPVAEGKMDASDLTTDSLATRDSDLSRLRFESPVPGAVGVDIEPVTVRDDDVESISVTSDTPLTETVANAMALGTTSDSDSSPTQTAVFGSLYSSLFPESLASEIFSTTSNPAPNEVLHAELSSGSPTEKESSPLPAISDVNDQPGYAITEGISEGSDVVVRSTGTHAIDSTPYSALQSPTSSLVSETDSSHPEGHISNGSVKSPVVVAHRDVSVSETGYCSVFDTLYGSLYPRSFTSDRALEKPAYRAESDLATGLSAPSISSAPVGSERVGRASDVSESLALLHSDRPPTHEAVPPTSPSSSATVPAETGMQRSGSPQTASLVTDTTASGVSADVWPVALTQTTASDRVRWVEADAVGGDGLVEPVSCDSAGFRSDEGSSVDDNTVEAYFSAVEDQDEDTLEETFSDLETEDRGMGGTGLRVGTLSLRERAEETTGWGDQTTRREEPTQVALNVDQQLQSESQEVEEHARIQTGVEEQARPQTGVEEQARPQTEVAEHARPQTEVEEHARPQTEVAEHARPQTEVEEHARPQTEVEEHAHPQTEVEEHARPQTEVEEHARPHTEVEEHAPPQTEVEEHAYPQTEVEEHAGPQTKVEEHARPQAKVEEHARPQTEVEEHVPPQTEVEEHARPQLETARGVVELTAEEERDTAFRRVSDAECHGNALESDVEGARRPQTKGEKGREAEREEGLPALPVGQVDALQECESALPSAQACGDKEEEEEGEGEEGSQGNQRNQSTNTHALTHARLETEGHPDYNAQLPALKEKVSWSPTGDAEQDDTVTHHADNETTHSHNTVETEVSVTPRVEEDKAAAHSTDKEITHSHNTVETEVSVTPRVEVDEAAAHSTDKEITHSHNTVETEVSVTPRVEVDETAAHSREESHQRDTAHANPARADTNVPYAVTEEEEGTRHTLADTAEGPAPLPARGVIGVRGVPHSITRLTGAELDARAAEIKDQGTLEISKWAGPEPRSTEKVPAIPEQQAAVVTLMDTHPVAVTHPESSDAEPTVQPYQAQGSPDALTCTRSALQASDIDVRQTEADSWSDGEMNSGQVMRSSTLIIRPTTPPRQGALRYRKVSLVTEDNASADLSGGAVDDGRSTSLVTAPSETDLEPAEPDYTWRNRYEGVYQYTPETTREAFESVATDGSYSSPSSFSSFSSSSYLPQTTLYTEQPPSSSSSSSYLPQTTLYTEQPPSSFSSSSSSSLPQTTLYTEQPPSSFSSSSLSHDTIRSPGNPSWLSDRSEVQLSRESQPGGGGGGGGGGGVDGGRSWSEWEEPAAPAGDTESWRGAEREGESVFVSEPERIKSGWDSQPFPVSGTSPPLQTGLGSSISSTGHSDQDDSSSFSFSGVFQATRVDLLPDSPTTPSPASPEPGSSDMEILVDTLKSMDRPQRPKSLRGMPSALFNSLAPIEEDTPALTLASGPTRATPPPEAPGEVPNGLPRLPLDLGLKKSSPKQKRTPLDMMKEQQVGDAPWDRGNLSLPLRSSALGGMVSRRYSLGSELPSEEPVNGVGGLQSPGTGSRLDNSILFSSYRSASTEQPPLENGKGSPGAHRTLFRSGSLPDSSFSYDHISTAPSNGASSRADPGAGSRFDYFSLLAPSSPSSTSGSLPGVTEANSRMSRPSTLSYLQDNHATSPTSSQGEHGGFSSPKRLLSPTGSVDLYRSFTTTDSSSSSVFGQSQGTLGSPLGLQRSFSSEGYMGNQQSNLFGSVHGGSHFQSPEPQPQPENNMVPKYRAFPDAYLTKEKEHGKLNPRPGKLFIFDRPGMCGQRFEVHSDVIDATPWELQETISIRVVRGGWVLYEKPNFKGEKIALDEGDIEINYPFGLPEEKEQTLQDGQMENGERSEALNGEEKEEVKPARKFIIGSIRRAVRDYSVPEISLFPEENAEGKKVIFRDTSDDARIFGFPIKANSIIISAGLWLVYAEPFFQGVPRVLEVGGFPNPASWGVQNPYVGSVHPLKIGEPRVECPSEPRLEIYDKPYFTGKSRILYTSMRDFMTRLDRQQTAFMYSVGSLKVLGGCWVGFEKEGFRGKQYLLEEGEYHDWRVWGGCNAELRSVRVIRADLTEPVMVMCEQPQEDEEPEEQEEHTFEVRKAIADVELFEYKTNIRSIHVLSGAWVAYSHVDFSGDQYILEKGFYNNCADWGGPDNRICSVQPILLAPNDSSTPRNQVLLYSEPDFQGDCYVCDTNHEVLSEKLIAKSCRVLGGSWVVYEDIKYSGNLYVLAEGDYANFTSMGCPPTCVIRSLKSVPLVFSIPSVSLFGLECLEGKEITVEMEVLSMLEEGFNNHVLSVRVNSGCWVLCEHSNYRGRQFLLEPVEITNWPKFSQLQMIGSMYPVRQRRRFFRVRNKERGHVLSIQGGVEEMKSGRVVVTEQVEGQSDLWFYQDGLLKNKLAPTMSLQVMGTVEEGAKVVLWSESRQPIQTWSAQLKGCIASLIFPSMVLDVKGGKTYDKDHVVLMKENEERPCQQWDLELL